jgi:hypothetical protein
MGPDDRILTTSRSLLGGLNAGQRGEERRPAIAYSFLRGWNAVVRHRRQLVLELPELGPGRGDHAE